MTSPRVLGGGALRRGGGAFDRPRSPRGPAGQTRLPHFRIS